MALLLAKFIRQLIFVSPPLCSCTAFVDCTNRPLCSGDQLFYLQGHPVFFLPAFVEQVLVHRQKLGRLPCAKGKETISTKFPAIKWDKLSYLKSRKSRTRFANHKSRKKICGYMKKRLRTATELPCSEEKGSFLQNVRTQINDLGKGFTTQVGFSRRLIQTWPCSHHLYLSNASICSSHDTTPLID